MAVSYTLHYLLWPENIMMCKIVQTSDLKSFLSGVKFRLMPLASIRQYPLRLLFNISHVTTVKDGLTFVTVLTPSSNLYKTGVFNRKLTFWLISSMLGDEALNAKCSYFRYVGNFAENIQHVSML